MKTLILREMINNNKWLIIKLSLESEPKDIIVPEFGLSLPKNIFGEGGRAYENLKKLFAHWD